MEKTVKTHLVLGAQIMDVQGIMGNEVRREVGSVFWACGDGQCGVI